MAKIKIFNIDFDSSENLEEIEKVQLKNNFFLLVELELGLDGEKGSELFRFNVCDAEGLLNEIRNESKSNSCLLLNDFNIILLESFKFDVLLYELSKIFEEVVTHTDDWKIIARRLNKYFYWEYEDEFW